MALDAVQKSPNSPNQVSYIKTSAIGALSGYALKYLIPVTAPEKDDIYNDTLRQNRLNAIEQKAGSIRKLKAPLRDDLFDMSKGLSEKARENLTMGKRNLDAVTKNLRPTYIFVGVGLIVGFLAALVTNILRRIDYYNAQYPENVE